MARPSEYKKTKKSKRKVDRISQLPDEVLGHIISYLPTKQSVQTSVLSKRWLLVWINVSYIDIDDSTLSAMHIVGTNTTVHTSFINFIDTIFNPSNEASIRKFSLKCGDKFDLVHINRWILAAAKHRVRELDICITRKKLFTMSNSLFAYQELVELKLGKRFILNDLGTFCFPSLKKLHLHSVEFNGDAINKFLSSCPVLEGLHLEHCWGNNLDTLDINAPALKFLTFDVGGLHKYKLILEAQNLEVLNCSGTFSMKGCCFKNLNSLVKADINIDLCFMYGHEKKNCTRSALDMVRGISNAKSLRLVSDTLKLFSFPDVVDLPIFHNLTKLQLTDGKHCGLLLSQLLHNSPNLEVLVMRFGYPCDFKWQLPSSVPMCLYLHLKVVKLWGFKEQKYVCRFIRFVLRHAKVLNEFFIARSKSNFKEVNISHQELTYLTRKTKHVEVLPSTTCCKSEPKEIKISEELLTYLKRCKKNK